MDHCTMEGLSPSRNIQVSPVNALVSIIRHHGVYTILKWVDDFFFFCVPTHSTLNDKNESIQHCSKYIALVFSIMAPLGMPWNPVTIQGQDFVPSIVYVGFLWDLTNIQSCCLPRNA